MKQEDKAPEHVVQAYNNILQRVEKSLADVEVKTWETIKQEIDQAVEFEQGLAKLTKEEWNLLEAYVKRDMKELYHFVAETGKGLREWLKLDLDLIEQRIGDALLSIADKTLVDLEKLDYQLHHDPGTYVAGEVACPGVLRCDQCGKMVCLVETSHIDACHRCQGIYFQRLTSRWPYEPELEGERDSEGGD
ncbi:predicted metalloendopeptidase [Hahella chejuensis KCTC 2396]|uniref:Predicted metalloendopeptidase n=1 Tax=Hahella chejuensis (strain KCTC 2396) TaxID=349521 RepID=Q2SBE9_HAHCH|nr:zinc ribbon-containing protein [Hahella chejuensis]ABC32025.1 predicted metalloendopeptidase [Hahella chejuensis KCTC 2396]